MPCGLLAFVCRSFPDMSQSCSPALSCTGPCGAPPLSHVPVFPPFRTWKCSVCSVSLYIRDLRPIHILPISAIRSRAEASFTLLTRPKAGFGGSIRPAKREEKRLRDCQRRCFAGSIKSLYTRKTGIARPWSRQLRQLIRNQSKLC